MSFFIQSCLPFRLLSGGTCSMSRSLMLLIVILSRSTSFLPDRYGKLKVNLNPAFIGETMLFTCVITDDSLPVNSSAIWIRRPNSNTSLGSVVNQKLTSTTIEVKVTSISDAGVYYCTLTTPGGDFGLGYVRIDVDYPLAAVTSLNCTTRSQQVQCSYSLPRDYRHPEHITGRVSYSNTPEESIDTGTNRRFSLPPGYDLFLLYYFQIQLLYSGRNVTSMSEYFPVNPMDVVIPKAVKDVVVKNTKTRSLQLSWQPPDDAATYTYRVTWTVVGDKDKQTHNMETNFTQSSLSNLRPSTNYTINVKCRERHRQEGYWSYGYFITVKTLEAVPGRAPRVSPAVARTDGGSVVVYWQPLSPKEENGEMQGYRVQCGDEGERRVGPGGFSETLDNPTERRGLWCDVYAVNNIGMSPSSSLYIPSRRQVPRCSDKFSIALTNTIVQQQIL
ncbi:neogenin-like [Haliotis rufescens]|uniref:neogenin-like n=1 Tax=Haliotis rufescens TaxID=6454 RepID=UPI00201F32D8|nr:neogenin-like [Haliotis rufescens]